MEETDVTIRNDEVKNLPEIDPTSEPEQNIENISNEKVVEGLLRTGYTMGWLISKHERWRTGIEEEIAMLVPQGSAYLAAHPRAESISNAIFRETFLISLSTSFGSRIAADITESEFFEKYFKKGDKHDKKSTDESVGSGRVLNIPL